MDANQVFVIGFQKVSLHFNTSNRLISTKVQNCKDGTNKSYNIKQKNTTHMLATKKF